MRLQLDELMRTHYGTSLTPISDVTPAIHNGLRTIRANGGRGTICVPGGFNGHIRSQIDPSLLSGNYIEGEGSTASMFTYCLGGGAAFYFNGAGGFTGGGLRGIGLMLNAGLGDTTATAILLQGDATYQPDQMMFEDLYVSSLDSNAFWYTGFQAYGNLRDKDPQGVRVADLRMVQLFQNRSLGMYLGNAVQWTLTNVGLYTGKNGGNNLYVTGGGQPRSNSTNVTGTGIVASNIYASPATSTGVTINGQKYS